MKNLFFLILSVAFLISCDQVNSNSITNAKADFKVWGNCNMCKETIESSLKVNGVSKVDWNTESKQIVVNYDSTKINLDTIQKYIAEAGYDNDKYEAQEEAYSKLPQCCQYERKP